MNLDLKSILKSGLLATVLLSLSTSLHARVIVSDLDDTVKITEVQTVNAVWNALAEVTVFTGMPELLMELKEAEQNSKLTVLSGSPNFIRLFVKDLLYFHNIEHDDLILLGSGKKKPQALTKIAQSTKQKMILIGDDQENDPKFYTDLKKQFPDQVQAVYIHRLNNDRNKPLPAGAIPYFTAYEIALHETSHGRLSLDALDRVRAATIKKMVQSSYNSELRETAVDELFPSWGKCDIADVQTILKPWLKSDLADKNTIQVLIQLANIRCKSMYKAKSEKSSEVHRLSMTWDAL